MRARSRRSRGRSGRTLPLITWIAPGPSRVPGLDRGDRRCQGRDFRRASSRAVSRSCHATASSSRGSAPTPERAGAGRILTFGAHPDADWRLVDAEPRGRRQRRRSAVRSGDGVGFKLALPGRHWVMNALAVLAVCEALGSMRPALASRLGHARGACRSRQAAPAFRPGRLGDAHRRKLQRQPGLHARGARRSRHACPDVGSPPWATCSSSGPTRPPSRRSRGRGRGGRGRPGLHLRPADGGAVRSAAGLPARRPRRRIPRRSRHLSGRPCATATCCWSRARSAAAWRRRSPPSRPSSRPAAGKAGT